MKKFEVIYNFKSAPIADNLVVTLSGLDRSDVRRRFKEYFSDLRCISVKPLKLK